MNVRRRTVPRPQIDGKVMALAGLKYFGDQAVLGILVVVSASSSRFAVAKQPAPECLLFAENGGGESCDREQLPACMWQQWEAVRRAKPGEDCFAPPCELEGDFRIYEVDLDGNSSTREFVTRSPRVFTGGTAESNDFVVQQVVAGYCSTLYVGNGLLMILEALEYGYRMLYERAALGGPSCYFGILAWNGRKYTVKQESADGACESEFDEWERRAGPVHLTISR